MSQNARYGLVVVVSIVLSAGGILLAAYSADPSDGGRGGAVAVAFAFFVLFIRRDYGTRVYKALTLELPSLKAQVARLRAGGDPSAANSEGVDSLKRQVTAIVARLETEATGQKNQNVALALASVIGTLAWGFGDVIAKWLKALL
jgi:hypothetical protein